MGVDPNSTSDIPMLVALIYSFYRAILSRSYSLDFVSIGFAISIYL